MIAIADFLPFENKLNSLPSGTARLETVGAAVDKIFAQAGLSD